MKETLLSFCSKIFTFIKRKFLQDVQNKTTEEIKEEPKVKINQELQSKQQIVNEQKKEQLKEPVEEEKKKQPLKLEDINYIGWCHAQGKMGFKQNWEEAIKWFNIAAEKGFADAQCNLGICYQNGWGVQKNIDKAIELYTKAAKQGHAQAQNNLGSRYFEGDGVQKDINEAIRWWLKAAENGDSHGLINLINCHYFDGKEKLLQYFKRKVQDKNKK